MTLLTVSLRVPLPLDSHPDLVALRSTAALGCCTRLLHSSAAPNASCPTQCKLPPAPSKLRCLVQVEGGNDIFLSLSGRYLPSCFGLSWPTLAALPR